MPETKEEHTETKEELRTKASRSPTRERGFKTDERSRTNKAGLERKRGLKRKKIEHRETKERLPAKVSRSPTKERGFQTNERSRTNKAGLERKRGLKRKTSREKRKNYFERKAAGVQRKGEVANE